MYSIDTVEKMLEEIADDIPDEFFKNLNGGIILLPESKQHHYSKGDLYIMGEYNNRHDFGRFICIYYGSFMRVHADLPEAKFKEKLKKTLLHEFTHHLESLSGQRDLEYKDEDELNRYKRIYK